MGILKSVFKISSLPLYNVVNAEKFSFPQILPIVPEYS